MKESKNNIEDKPTDVADRLRSLANLIEAGYYDYTANISVKGDSFKYIVEGKRKMGVAFSDIAGGVAVEGV